jgi:hypothetical protein
VQALHDVVIVFQSKTSQTVRPRDLNVRSPSTLDLQNSSVAGYHDPQHTVISPGYWLNSERSPAKALQNALKIALTSFSITMRPMICRNA